MLLIPITATDTDAIVEWASTIVGDVMPLLIIFIGIAIAGYVLKVILNLRG